MRRIKELQPDASQRAIAAAVGAGRRTIQRDLDEGGSPEPPVGEKPQASKDEGGSPEPPSPIFNRTKKQVQNTLDSLYSTAYSKDQNKELAALLREYATKLERKK